MKRFLTTLTLVLLVIGLIRVAIGSYASTGDFVPSYETLLNQFNSMPDVPSQLTADFNAINDAFNTMTNGFSTINSLGSFFVAIGNFFSLTWTIITLVVDSVLIPIQYLLWVFQTLFGFTA